MKKQIFNQKHLSGESRIFIETSLNEGHLIKDIAAFLSKDPSTISKEIKRNRSYKEPRKVTGSANLCKHMYTCQQHSVCGLTSCMRECRTCSKCNSSCKLFEREICKTLVRAPYVCNACSKKSSCRLEKYYYRSSQAQKQYESLRSSSREGINLSEEELQNLNELTVPLIQKGQPVAHIFAKHSNDIPCTIRTFYNYVENNVLSLSNIELRRKVRYKKRKSKTQPTIRRNSKLLIGRKYEDFTKYTSENPDSRIVEMDTVEGIKGGKVLLTLFFRETKLMIMVLMNDKTQQSVTNVFDVMEKAVGYEVFRQIFPLILTDNGSEFLDAEGLEKSGQIEGKRTSIYYCDPNCSFQKGSIEKNHEYIRYVIPKGNSFNDYTQDDIGLLMNHINSTARNCLNGRTPLELANLLMNISFMKFLNLELIPYDEVCLNAQLLSKKSFKAAR